MICLDFRIFSLKIIKSCFRRKINFYIIFFVIYLFIGNTVCALVVQKLQNITFLLVTVGITKLLFLSFYVEGMKIFLACCSFRI